MSSQSQGAIGGATSATLGTIYSGMMKQQVAGREADQLRINAQAARAAGTSAAEIARKKTALIQSAATAAAGGSGAGVTDVGVQEVQAETGRTGEYNALAALYAGNSEAVNLRNQAAQTQWAGTQALNSSLVSGISSFAKADSGQTDDQGNPTTIGQEGMSMLEKYGGQLPEWFAGAG